MLDNYDISAILSQYARLYELHGGNPFKVKSLTGAAYNVKKIGESLAEMSDEELAKVPQLGKSLAPKVREIIETGSFAELNKLLEATPEGVIDILRIKGLGPKKVEYLWKTINITSIPELMDACRENRLVDVKGFGVKLQEQIQADIEFKFNSEGKFHWAKLEPIVEMINDLLENMPLVEQYQVVGDFRRLNQVVESLDYIIDCEDMQAFSDELCEGKFELLDFTDEYYILTFAEAVNVTFYKAEPESWGNIMLEKSSAREHLELIGYNSGKHFEEEDEIYKSLGITYIIPELREGLKELEYADKQEKLIKFSELKGILHNHSTYSDGLHSLSEMAAESKRLGMEYFAICDHSQTAFYANGLKPERILDQMAEIDILNAKMKPFRVFKGIESDILNDGSLDYTEDILQMFDLVVASIHSNLKMDIDKATKRLKTAIENPYTTILGHPTGRQLLIRSGYPIDHAYIIDACVANGVAIELNAHPYRLDIDWRWIDYAVNKGGIISINPDAHQKEGLSDMQYGVNVARKGYLTAEHCLNAKSLSEFTVWLEKKRSKSL